MFNQKPLGFGTVVPVYKLRIGVFQRAPSPVDCAVSFHAPPIVLSIVSQSSCIKRKNISFSATIQKALFVFSD